MPHILLGILHIFFDPRNHSGVIIISLVLEFKEFM